MGQLKTKHIGGIAGTMASGTKINRCSFAGILTDAGTNTVGGIVGYADQTANVISNSINYGRVQSKGSETNTGGILGYVNYASFKISHCVNVGNVSGNTTYAGQIIGRQMKAMTTLPSNLYYLDGGTLTAYGSGTNETSATGVTAVNAEQLASGEVCYKLNGDQTEINWYQTLQADPYPVLDFTHKIVFHNDTDGYYNQNDIKGDMNGDGKVDIADAVSILNLMAEGGENPDADQNGDGKIDIADFVTILNLMAEQ